MLRFELRHYMYLPPYLSHALCHPSTGVPDCLLRFPGVPPQSGSTTGLPYITPHRSSEFGGHTLAEYPYKLPFGEFLEVPHLQF